MKLMTNNTSKSCHLIINRLTELNQKYKLKSCMLVIFTNLVTIYIFIGSFSFMYQYHSSLSPRGSNSILQELNSTKAQLATSHTLLSELHHRLNSTNLLVQPLLIDLTRQQDKQSNSAADHENPMIVRLGNGDPTTTAKLTVALGSHNLPFGYSPKIGSDEIHMPVGEACMRFHEELNQYMAYDIGGECPVDDVLAQGLMLKGCEPFPRRRCHPKSPKNYVEPMPLPDSLWTTSPDTNIIWDPYACKSYQCLVDRKNEPGSYDCKGCFDFQGKEKSRWLFDDGGLDFGINQVLATKAVGTIRIGLDIGGGTRTFAARMRERNVTIITSTLNLDGPFNNMVASRGLIPMHI